MAANYPSMIGMTFGRLTVLDEAPRRKRERCWSCRCSCGTLTEVRTTHLRRGRIRSCGCLQREQTALLSYVHGAGRRGAKTPEYNSWRGLCQRCRNRRLKDYGGRGITVCERWSGPNGFVNFLADVGPKPSPVHSIERLDNSRGYEPGNCVWATRTTQMRNTRRSHFVEAFGLRLTLSAWAERTGIKATVIGYRLRRGWSPEQALSEPGHGNSVVAVPRPASDTARS